MNVKYLFFSAALLLSAACDPSESRAVPSRHGRLPADPRAAAESGTPTKQVFVILMENHNWVDVQGSASAPYLNSLLAIGAHAEQFYNPPGVHPSEPNYLWMEAGTGFDLADDSPPAVNHQTTSQHLTALLRAANISWKSYQEDIPGDACPLTLVNKYDPKHNPFVFFDDNTGNGDPNDAFCIAHNRPYTELAADLVNDTTPSYAFITPNLCNIMHDTCPPQSDQIKQGDAWLSQELPNILESKAYQEGATVFITWDEGEDDVDGPIGMIVLSKNVKVGYSNRVRYTHSATLRTLQEIFGVMPLLGDAANSPSLADLFRTFP